VAVINPSLLAKMALNGLAIQQRCLSKVKLGVSASFVYTHELY
jgi:hypothetical protein